PKEPHDIRIWCLGNELDGPWQVGHKTADEYGRLAAETARAMRMVDPSLELVACGSSNSSMPTFASWEATMLEHCYDIVDYVSLHSYYDPLPTDLPTFLASGVDLDRAIEAIVATADHVGARKKSRRRLQLSVDEWNVWHQSRFKGQNTLTYGDEPALIEDVYDVADAVVVGSLLITLLRHADRVAIGCQAQLVNVIAPILTRDGGPAWRQTIFHPFAQVTQWARGEVLRLETSAEHYSTEKYGDVSILDVTATYDEENGTVTVLCVNRSTTEPVHLDADVRAFPGCRVEAATVLHDTDHHAHNTERHPDLITPRNHQDVAVVEDRLQGVLPPVSWTVIRLSTKQSTHQAHRPTGEMS
ncbi:MAG: alpha-L-arabinofuranosidase, partial [Chloroflexota bacterium]|nr:alpha-L-arabinofuranosidase [Chloroflexota bacterium]